MIKKVPQVITSKSRQRDWLQGLAPLLGLGLRLSKSIFICCLISLENSTARATGRIGQALVRLEALMKTESIAPLLGSEHLLCRSQVPGNHYFAFFIISFDHYIKNTKNMSDA